MEDKSGLINALKRNTTDEVDGFIRQNNFLNKYHQRLQDIGCNACPESSALAEFFLRQVEQIGIDQLANNIESFLDESKYPGIEVLAINGIEIDSSIEFANGINLVPFNLIPDSDLKAIYDHYSVSNEFKPNFVSEDFKRQMATQQYFNGYGAQKPTAALICDYPDYSPKRFFDVKSSNVIEIIKILKSRHDELIEICRFLTLIGPSSPTPMVIWWQDKGWIPWNVISLNSKRFLFDIINVPSNKTINKDDSEKARLLYNNFTRLPTTIKDKLSIPLERLNRAIRRMDFVDKAIELGIASEAIFLNDDSGKQGELAYRLRLRAAWLLGEGDDSAREKILKLFNTLYEYRSRSVHTGNLKENNAEEILNNAVTRISEAIKILIEKGSWPNWNILTLGGGFISERDV